MTPWQESVVTWTRLVVVEVVRMGQVQSAYADTTLPCSCLSASGRGLRSLQRPGFWADSTRFPKDLLGPPCLLFQKVWSSPVVFKHSFLKSWDPPTKSSLEWRGGLENLQEQGPQAPHSTVGRRQCPHPGSAPETESLGLCLMSKQLGLQFPLLFLKVCYLDKKLALSSSCRNEDCRSTFFVDECSTRQNT